MVLPGRIATDLGHGQPTDLLRSPDERTRPIPISRMGSPADLQGIAVYLMSDASAYHTGDVITVDGGLSVTLP
jgi:NAD(P)-dependent dehydrogenase (short-subunit alcohol dehydrogenase family)